MTETTFRPQRLDVRAFAQNAAQLQGTISLLNLERLTQDLYGSGADLSSNCVQWSAQGDTVAVAGGSAQNWLHLNVQATLPMQCQRCLQAMTQPLHIQRSFRFVRDEQEANAQDDDCEEDLLVASKQFDLLQLIEDELIMALPFAPTHEVCPVAVKLKAVGEDFEAALKEKPKAFAALGELKGVLGRVKAS